MLKSMIDNTFTTECEYVNAMHQAVLKVSSLVKRKLTDIHFIRDKRKYLANIEKKVTEIIYSNLLFSYEYDILYENGPEIEDNIYWILDPIDGSKNFLNSIPLFTINLALQKKNRIIAGVIYDVMRNDLYWASENIGAYVNRMELSVLNNNTLATREYITSEYSLRSLGSTGLEIAYTASGKYSGYFVRKPNIWDIAAGKLLITEAKGYIEHNDDYFLCGEKEFCISFRTKHINSNNLHA